MIWQLIRLLGGAVILHIIAAEKRHKIHSCCETCCRALDKVNEQIHAQNCIYYCSTYDCRHEDWSCSMEAFLASKNIGNESKHCGSSCFSGGQSLFAMETYALITNQQVKANLLASKDNPMTNTPSELPWDIPSAPPTFTKSLGQKT